MSKYANAHLSLYRDVDGIEEALTRLVAEAHTRLDELMRARTERHRQELAAIEEVRQAAADVAAARADRDAMVSLLTGGEGLR